MRKYNKTRKVGISQTYKLKREKKKKRKKLNQALKCSFIEKKKVFRFLLGLMVNQLYFLPCYKELVFKEELGLIKN